MTDTEDELPPKTYEITFDGKQPFTGHCVIGEYSPEAAEKFFRDALPEEITDLKVSVREMPEEERTAFFEKLEGKPTLQ